MRDCAGKVQLRPAIPRPSSELSEAGTRNRQTAPCRSVPKALRHAPDNDRHSRSPMWTGRAANAGALRRARSSSRQSSACKWRRCYLQYAARSAKRRYIDHGGEPDAHRRPRLAHLVRQEALRWVRSMQQRSHRRMELGACGARVRVAAQQAHRAGKPCRADEAAAGLQPMKMAA